MTDCQTHPGVPFRFDVTDDTFSFLSNFGVISGTPLAHLAPPAFGALFESGDITTLLLTVTATGEAVFTQHQAPANGGIQSTSYFGTCEPGA